MSVSVVRQGNEATIKLGLPAAEVNKGFLKAVKNVSQKVNIPGFRKGKAPRHILENYVGKDSIKQEAFELLANECYTKALQEEKLIPVDEPKVKDSKFEENEDLDITLTVTLKPEPELGEYRGLSVDKKEAAVSDEEVEAAINELRSRSAKMIEAKDAIIEKGDFAIIDFAGTVDGKPFSGGEGKGYPLEVGSGSFIPGFEDQLVGLKAGESTDVDVTFPEEYFVQELAGKEAVFQVNIQDVKRKELPELNDEFVAANSDSKTVEEFKNKAKERMLEGAKADAQAEYERALIAKAVENAKFEVPKIMVEDRIDRMIEELQLKLESRKMNMDMYMKYTGQDMAKIREMQQPAALENVKADLVLDAIAKAENIQLTEAEVEAEINALASQHGASAEEVKKIISENRNMGLLLANVLRRKAARLVVDSAKQ